MVFLCAEEAGGCGVLWTPTSRTAPTDAETKPWAWCPDCQVADE